MTAMPNRSQPGAPDGKDGKDDELWLEIVDSQGLYPIKVMGPYATAHLADRAQRGVMRLLNVRRYSVAVVSQQALQDRWPREERGA
jgi:hypothetical protein